MHHPSLKSTSRLLVAGCALVSLVALHCDPPDTTMPGTTIGTYSVSAVMSGTNTCGSLGAPSPWTFSADLSQDEKTLYWRQGDATISGTLDANNQATLQSFQSATIREPAPGSVGCSMSRADSISVTVNSNANATISGTITFSFAVGSATDCYDQLTINGGSYDTLPCQATYTFTGTRTGDVLLAGESEQRLFRTSIPHCSANAALTLSSRFMQSESVRHTAPRLRSAHLQMLLALGATLFLTRCALDTEGAMTEDEVLGGNAGSGGAAQAGAGGTSGVGGSSGTGQGGTGGSSGTAGQSTEGPGGSSGTAGSGGEAGGSAGSAGEPGGSGGTAGEPGGSAGTTGEPGGSGGTAGEPGGSGGTAGEPGGSGGTAGEPGGSGGTAGEPGTGGSAGETGGSAGTGGDSGTGGTAGSGGESGTAGSGGESGSGGTAGSGGGVVSVCGDGIVNGNEQCDPGDEKTNALCVDCQMACPTLSGGTTVQSEDGLNHCYVMGANSTKRKWSDAQSDCRKLGPNCDLVTINSAAEFAFLKSKLPFDGRVWSGGKGRDSFSDNSTQTAFTWSNGEFFSIGPTERWIKNGASGNDGPERPPWASGQPDNATGGQCLQFYNNAGYALDDTGCNADGNILCECGAPGAVCNGNGVIDPGEECDDGNFTDNDGCSSKCKIECDPPNAQFTSFKDPMLGHCYLVSAQTQSWQNASNSCNGLEGFSLARITTVAEFNFVSTKLPVNANVWVDGSDIAVEGKFVFGDNSPVPFANNVYPWRPGEPNNTNNNEHCIQINNFGSTPKGRFFNDSVCGDAQRFVCERAVAGATGP